MRSDAEGQLKRGGAVRGKKKGFHHVEMAKRIAAADYACSYEALD